MNEHAAHLHGDGPPDACGRIGCAEAQARLRARRDEQQDGLHRHRRVQVQLREDQARGRVVN